VIAAALQLFQQHAVAALFGLDSHQQHHGIDQAPGEVAAERGHEQRAHFLASVGGHADGTDEAHGHEQSEDDFGGSVDGIERRLRGVGEGGLCIHCAPGMK